MDRHALVDGEGLRRIAKSTDTRLLTITGVHARVNAMQAF
jgi:hypothetical protein